MKILVTGGAGFIGSNFIHFWLDKHPSDKIINLDKLTYAGNPASLEDIVGNRNYYFVKGDICNSKLVNELTRNVDLIVHFAAESHVDRSITGALPFIKTNVEGTLNLLEAAKINGNIRFHHISTDEVFGALPVDKPRLKFTEKTPYDPRSPYSSSKAAADHLVRSYFHTHKLPVTISNCSNNYGPYHFPEKLIPLVITRALNDEKIPVYGNGKQVRDWIHVTDHCRAIELIIKKGKIGDTYLAGGESERENIWIIKYILKKLGKPTSLLARVPDRKGHDVRYAVSIAKIKHELEFTPSVSIEKGLDDTIEWYLENEQWWKKLKKKADVVAGRYLAGPANL